MKGRRKHVSLRLKTYIGGVGGMLLPDGMFQKSVIVNKFHNAISNLNSSLSHEKCTKNAQKIQQSSDQKKCQKIVQYDNSLVNFAYFGKFIENI